MFFFLIPIIILWFIREIKTGLFWLYLWQLKEYHWGRFFDHFRTGRGRRIFLNPLFGLKVILFIYALFLGFSPSFSAVFIYAVWILILTLLYFFESAKFLADLFRKKAKKPVLTKKTLFLVSTSLLFFISVLALFFLKIEMFFWFVLSLLFADLATPVFVLTIVLLFQPLTFCLRGQIIKKAKAKRDRFKDLIAVGITGSYGKTSTKEFLAEILSEKYKVLKTKEHQNSEAGVSRCILDDLNESHQIFVAEMAAYNRGAIKLLCEISRPKIGILTGINQQHMALQGTQENIIKTKFELPESLPEDGIAIFNGDNQFIVSCLKNPNEKLKVRNQKFYSIKEKSDIWAGEIQANKEQVLFKAFAKDGQVADFKVNVLGTHNVLNVLGAALCAKELGMNLSEIARACLKIRPEKGGCRLKRGLNGVDVIDSTYSSNPDGVISHLEHLKLWSGKKIIIMPCLIELGKASKEVHKRIGKKIGEVCDLAVIVSKERFKELKEGANGGKTQMVYLEKLKNISRVVKEFCQPGNVLLLEGRLPKELRELCQ